MRCSLAHAQTVGCMQRPAFRRSPSTSTWVLQQQLASFSSRQAWWAWLRLSVLLHSAGLAGTQCSARSLHMPTSLRGGALQGCWCNGRKQTAQQRRLATGMGQVRAARAIPGDGGQALMRCWHACAPGLRSTRAARPPSPAGADKCTQAGMQRRMNASTSAMPPLSTAAAAQQSKAWTEAASNVGNVPRADRAQRAGPAKTLSQPSTLSGGSERVVPCRCTGSKAELSSHRP